MIKAMWRNRKIFVLITLFCVLIYHQTSALKKADNSNDANLEEITHKVFFDVSIDNEPAGRVVMGLFGKV